ncbi:LOW QUALITY PROTEIN: hypothetical protein MSG28_007210 [Choristoneura fumiferana]|uniref:Uncharacterized protein n=1 Tax=Choristoneura fumiferana TaxID=7141 RepID=A0ACC0JMW5_CHOFU|nr:LOW QUALITY PROTEIN: hypothetical protein MSG28_007210 [Choristoneura fumiferana]
MSSEGAEGGGGGGGAARAPAPVRYCAVYTCLHNYKTHPHLAYFSIPTPPKRRLKWLKKIRRMDILRNGKVSGYHRVCEVHFKPEDIGRTASGARKRLLARAAPALRLPHGDTFVTVHEPPPPRAAPSPPPPPPPPPPTVALRARTLAASRLEVFQYVDNTPRRPARTRPRPDDRPAQRRPPAPPAAPATPLADFFAACDRHLTRTWPSSMAQLRPRDGETSGGLHELGVRLLAGAPAAYRALAPTLGLPPPRALRRPHGAGPAELLALRVARMTDTEKHCTVGLHVVAVRPRLYYDITGDRIIGLHEVDGLQEPWPARRCAVLTARALFGAWTQPVAACCLAEQDGLRAWTDGVLRRLLAAGLRVRALVADPTWPPRAGPTWTPRNPSSASTDTRFTSCTIRLD